MNKFYTIFTCCILWSFSLSAQTIGYKWSGDMGGASNDRGQSIGVDHFGNVYTTGWFESIADFNPNTTTSYTLMSQGSYDIFISKLDSSGNFVWAKSIGGPDGDLAASLDIDSHGNVYTAGVFYSDTVDFDPGPGTYTLTHQGNEGIFISKLNPSGNFVWAKQMSGKSGDLNCFSMAIDNSGNVYTTGYIQDTVDFDPGSGTYTLASGGNDAIFISKLDSSGNFVWAKLLSGSGTSFGTSITSDGKKNVYTTGSFNGLTDFDPGSGTFYINATGGSDIFISKLDSLGNFILAKAMGNYIDGSQPISIAVDDLENIYTTGSFSNTVDFDPGPSIHNLNAFYDDAIFVSKLNSLGKYVWAIAIDTTYGNTNSGAIALDRMANVYLTGYFQNTVGFGDSILTAAAAYSAFVCKLDSSSNILWAGELGDQSGSSSYGMAIAVDSLQNIYTTGLYTSDIDCDPGPAIHIITSHGSTDAFVVKLNQIGNNNAISLNKTISSKNDGYIYPNPNNGNFTIETNFSEKQNVQIFDINGNMVFNKLIINTSNIDVSSLSDGVYNISIINNQGALNKRLVIVK